MSMLALALAAPTFLAAPQAPFDPPRDLFGAIGAIERADFADLNGNGRTDGLLVGLGVDFVPDLGSGDPTVRLELPVGLPVDAAVFGDVDGDSILDLLVLSPSGDAWFTFSTQNGGASFMELGSGSLAETPLLPRIFDVDGDGDGDLVGVLSASRLGWFENLSGAFAASPQILDPGPVATVATRRPYDLADVDGDGLEDLVLIIDGPAPLRILPALGGGAFGAALAPPTGSVRDLRFTDADLDGDLDIVGFDPPTVARLENTGGFSFAAPTVVAGPPALNFVSLDAVQDLDGDGDEDLLASTFDAGTFLLDTFFIENVAGSYAQPMLTDLLGVLADVAWQDVDGDGDLDSVRAANTGVVVSRSSFPGGLLSAGTPETVTNTAPGTRRVLDVATGDVDGDGDLDVVGLLAGTMDAVVLVEGLGAGRFAEDRLVPADVSGALRISLGDLDGDGRADLLAEPFGAAPGRVLLSTSGGFVAAAQQPVRPGQGIANLVEQARMLDVDDDGDLDLLGRAALPSGQVSLSVHWNDGSAGGWSVTTIDDAITTARADIDGDGVLDLLTTRGALTGTSGSVALHRVLGPESLAPAVTLQVGVRLGFLEVDDVDRDGRDDLLFGSANPIAGRELRYAPGRAGGGFGPTILPLVSDVLLGEFGVSTARLADVDGDGLRDLVTNWNLFQAGVPREVALFRGAATGGFGPRETIVTSYPGFALEDLDQDGDLDLLAFALAGGGESTVLALDNRAREEVGQSVCGPANLNASGLSAALTAFGVVDVASTDLELRATGLPANTLGIFAASMTLTAPTPVAGSAGDLCLGGSIGRYDAPGQILNAGPGGQFALVIDPAAIEQPLGPQAAQVGESWAFQAWFRDVQGGAATSNFSDALVVTF